jgi:hypothetical protein
MAKRAKEYDKKLQLKEGVELDDLLGFALKSPAEKQAPKAKRAKGKKKK